MAMGKWAFGSGIAYTTYQMVQQGRFIGPAPKDRNQREAFYAAGKQPYSIVTRGEGFPRNKITGEFLPLFDSYGAPNGPLNYTSIHGFGPMASIISIYASAAESIASLPNDPEGAELAAQIGIASVFATFKYYEELPTLQGVSQIVNALRTLQSREEGCAVIRNFADLLSNSIVTNGFGLLKA